MKKEDLKRVKIEIESCIARVTHLANMVDALEDDIEEFYPFDLVGEVEDLWDSFLVIKRRVEEELERCGGEIDLDFDDEDEDVIEEAIEALLEEDDE